jgi:hypothetical protein
VGFALDMAASGHDHGANLPPEAAMPFRVVSTEAPALLTITLSGDWPSVQEQREARRPLIEQGKMSRESKAIVNITGVTGLPRFNEVEAAMMAAETDVAMLPKRIALVVQPGANFGVGRMLQSMAPADLAIELFTDEASARDWLLTT